MNYNEIYESPIGTLTIIVNETAVTGLYFGDEGFGADKLFGDEIDKVKKNELIMEVTRQLDGYFSGERQFFELNLEPTGTTFQKKVWQALTTIPYGETRSYREIAEMCDCPKGYRAVGMANNRNPIAIIIPCHRVIGADGRLVGYGGGMEKKEFLLNLENLKGCSSRTRS